MSEAIIAGVVIGALALAGGASGSWGMRQHARGAARLLGMPATAAETAFLGGTLSQTVSAGRPLARLELFAWGIRLGASARLLQFLPVPIPTWEARYGELAVVRHVASHRTHGLRFAVASTPHAVVFWSSRCAEILDRLEAAGATVDRSVRSLKQAGGVYTSALDGSDGANPSRS
jgi:hypothetical protein